jgi:hypothetical protein
MIILAVDQSPRNIGFCHGVADAEAKPSWGVQEFDSFGENGVLLIREVRKWMISKCEIVRPDAVYCEQIVINVNNINLPVTYQQFAVVAGIEAACEFIGCDCFMVDISKWRRRFLGRGNAPKWTVDRTNWLKDAACKAALELGWMMDSHHAAEAAGIWDYGCAHQDETYRRKTAARATRARMAMEDLARENGERLVA